ncbi:MAG: FKBP-type peptidyl-prolyl cis-trans isomerase FkpA [Crocinitomicaceae bacterium]|jgi:FKBP-type peptidyl-prolyl cis-trans isomerase FkpA
MKKIIFGLTILMLTSVMSCAPKYIKTMKELKLENPEKQEGKDQNIILDYLIANEIEAQKTESGIWYVITAPGEGDKPNENSKVKAHYNGTLLDSTKFDSSYDRGQPLDFSLDQVIKGWQEAIKMLGKGGKGTFYIPSGLAYGDRRTGASIPANTVLKFDIELVDFEEVLTTEERAEKDQEMIKKHLADNNIVAKKLESGIWCVTTQEGEGETPSVKASVTAHYSGRLLDGKKFDSSYDRDQPFTTTLNQVIVGWKKAIPTLKKGGKATFYIPSALAYGEQGTGPIITANSVLVFDIELVDFQEPMNPKEQATADAELIQDFLAKNKIEAEQDTSGIWYTITEPGTGGNPTLTSKVKTHYKGMLLNGTVFDSSYDRGQPAEFGLNQVISGWKIAIPKLQKGGKGTFYIPSGLAYGPTGTGNAIPPNAVLIFDVELLDFK